MEIGNLTFFEGNSFFTIFKNDIYKVSFTHGKNEEEIIRIHFIALDPYQYRPILVSGGKFVFSRADTIVLGEIEKANRTLRSVPAAEKIPGERLCPPTNGSSLP